MKQYFPGTDQHMTEATRHPLVLCAYVTDVKFKRLGRASTSGLNNKDNMLFEDPLSRDSFDIVGSNMIKTWS